jgi:hypothetical protein
MEYKIDPIGGNLRYPNHWMALSARDLVKFSQFYLQGGGLTKARAPISRTGHTGRDKRLWTVVVGCGGRERRRAAWNIHRFRLWR